MLTAFADDSGIEGLGPVFVLAGYVASVDQWLAFTDEWKASLEAVPRIEYFKMREANRLRGQFGGMEPADRDDKVSALVKTILKHVQFGVTATVWWSDFRGFKTEFPDTPFDPYSTLFHGFMAATVNHCITQSIGGPVDFIFDEQGLAGVRAAVEYDAIKQFLKPEETALLGGRPVQRDDKKVLPLQAADLIEWQTRRYISDNTDVPAIQLPESQKIRDVVHSLEQIPTVYKTYGPDVLRVLGIDSLMLKEKFPDLKTFIEEYSGDIPLKREPSDDEN